MSSDDYLAEKTLLLKQVRKQNAILAELSDEIALVEERFRLSNLEEKQVASGSKPAKQTEIQAFIDKYQDVMESETFDFLGKTERSTKEVAAYLRLDRQDIVNQRLKDPRLGYKPGKSDKPSKRMVDTLSVVIAETINILNLSLIEFNSGKTQAK